VFIVRFKSKAKAYLSVDNYINVAFLQCLNKNPKDFIQKCV
jgi:hypothetical protein